jgi:hypothetical protein
MHAVNVVRGNKLLCASSADETRGKPLQLPGPGGLECGPGPDYVAYVFVFLDGIIICRLYELTLSDQTQVTLPESLSEPALGSPVRGWKGISNGI